MQLNYKQAIISLCSNIQLEINYLGISAGIQERKERQVE